MYLSLKARRAKLQEPPRTRGNRDFTPQIPCTLGPRARAVIDKSLGQTYLQVLESLLERHLQLALGTQTPAAAIFRSSFYPEGGADRPTPLCGLLPPAFRAKTWPHLTVCRHQCWDASGQTTNWAGIQPQPSADRHLKTF